MTTLVLSALMLLGSKDSANTTISKSAVVEVWRSSQPPDKKTGGWLIAGGIAGVLVGAIAKPPEAGPSAGFYAGVPLVAVGAYVQHHKRPSTLVFARSGQEPTVAGRTWPGVQALRAGTPVKVVMTGGEIEGTFVAANADELVIHLKRGDYSVDKTNIKRLDKKLPESNRGRNIDRGVAIGFLAGVVRSRLACHGCPPFEMLTLANSMTIGALVGATAPATNWETVYRRGK